MGHRWAGTAAALLGATEGPSGSQATPGLGTACSAPGAFYLDWNGFRKLESLSAFKHGEISARKSKFLAFLEKREELALPATGREGK